MNVENKLITILGPTAVGKTRFAVKLAYRLNGEIISADSRQVYTGMDIGTGKDYKDYFINNTQIKTHLIDIISPLEEFNLFLFRKYFYQAFKKITNNQKTPFLVGGTALYLNSILKKYTISEVNFNSKRAKYLYSLPKEQLKKILLNIKQNQHNVTDLIEKERIVKAILIAETENKKNDDEVDISSLIIGITDSRDIVKERIRKRLKIRLEEGMIDEVETLLAKGVTHEKLKFFGLEYKFISMYLNKELNYNDMYQKLASAIIQFSKRQMTWFRKMEREGIKIHWLKNNEITKAEKLIENFIH